MTFTSLSLQIYKNSEKLPLFFKRLPEGVFPQNKKAHNMPRKAKVKKTNKRFSLEESSHVVALKNKASQDQSRKTVGRKKKTDLKSHNDRGLGKKSKKEIQYRSSIKVIQGREHNDRKEILQMN